MYTSEVKSRDDKTITEYILLKRNEKMMDTKIRSGPNPKYFGVVKIKENRNYNILQRNKQVNGKRCEMKITEK